MPTPYEEAQKRVTEKNPCGLTRYQRLKSWFSGTRVGIALNVLRGRPTAYRITIEGRLIAKNNILIVDCFLRMTEVSYDQSVFVADLEKSLKTVVPDA
jgi:hypothetical protein